MLNTSWKFLSTSKIVAENLYKFSICVSIRNPANVNVITKRYYLTAPSFNPFLPFFVPSIQFVRNYAKNKDKKREKGKAKVEINEDQLAEQINLDSLKNNMEKAINNLKDDFVKQLSLRSTAGSIESIPVNVDGTEHTLQELAGIVRKNPKTIVVNMAIFPQAIPAALKAIAKSGMNLHPQQDGTTLYIPVPTVTKEHRESLARNAKALYRKCKENLRDVQNKHIKGLKKKEGISVDLIKNLEQQITAIADKHIDEAEQILKNKEDELLRKE